MQASTKGITLLELLITVSVVAILLSLAVPAYQNLQHKSRAKIMSAELMRAIHLTRSLAIAHGQLTTLCGSRDQQHCTGEWQRGHLIQSSNQIQFSLEYSDKQDVIHLRLFPRQLSELQFLPSGKSNFQNGTFWFCAKNANNPDWAMVMNQAGRVRLVYPDQYGTIYDDSNMALRC